MAKKFPDERLVFLALKDVFKGCEAQLRRSSKIRELVVQHQKDLLVERLVKTHGIDDVCVVTKTLLGYGVFEEKTKAERRFPGVFGDAMRLIDGDGEREAGNRTSEAQHTARPESSERAGRPGLASFGTNRSDSVRGRFQSTDITDKERSGDEDPATTPGHRILPPATVSVPSLYPAYLPYSSQHHLLVHLQTLLERACFQFAEKHLGILLADSDWNCPECVELHRWVKILQAHPETFDMERIATRQKPFEELLESIANLRHTAVHRLRVTVKTIELFIADSESLALLMGDAPCIEELARIREQVTTMITDLESTKDMLESRLAQTLNNIAGQRAELDKLEQDAISDLVRDDKRYQGIVSQNMSRLLTSLETCSGREYPNNSTALSNGGVSIV